MFQLPTLDIRPKTAFSVHSALSAWATTPMPCAYATKNRQATCLSSLQIFWPSTTTTTTNYLGCPRAPKRKIISNNNSKRHIHRGHQSPTVGELVLFAKKFKATKNPVEKILF
ncbi:hypothetical protein EVAR_42983_1 [Eumeta japonica]|uniref:Uncharacterized protein n=1 Tax=Eumeta variegata TaxID=151549 RepID=A0A4C1WB36_EUMVA|nr:hypothetical protein EVAR_42983_1 [Eumeta japonica]